MSVMKTKYLDKRGWRRLLQSNYHEKIINYKGEKILTGIIDIIEVRSPLRVPVLDKDILVCDDGYHWLQILPEGRDYSMTVMYDDDWNTLQYYFDINFKHILEPANARRKDIYLDVLALPDGRCELVDQKDLEFAKLRGDIAGDLYNFAYKTAHHIMDEIEKDFSQFEELASHCLNALKG